MRLICRLGASALVLAALAARLPAQEPTDPVAALRTKELLTDEDRATLRNWISQRLAGVVGNDAGAAHQALNELRGAAGGTSSFKEAYATACLELFGAAIKRAPDARAARLVSLLNSLGDRRTLPLLLEGLRDERPAVRAVAAIGLQRLQGQLAGDADAYGQALRALTDAGKKEASREALRLYYQAMNYSAAPSPPNPKPAIASLLEVLEERVRQYAGTSVRAEAAEVAALPLGDALRKNMDEGERQRYAVCLARLLLYAVNRYAAGETPLGLEKDLTSGPDLIGLRNAMEVLIRESERQLKDLLGVNPAPDVTAQVEKTRKGVPADLAPVLAEMKRWTPIVQEKLGVELVVPPPPPTTQTRPAEGRRP